MLNTEELDLADFQLDMDSLPETDATPDANMLLNATNPFVADIGHVPELHLVTGVERGLGDETAASSYAFAVPFFEPRSPSPSTSTRTTTTLSTKSTKSDGPDSCSRPTTPLDDAAACSRALSASPFAPPASSLVPASPASHPLSRPLQPKVSLSSPDSLISTTLACKPGNTAGVASAPAAVSESTSADAQVAGGREGRGASQRAPAREPRTEQALVTHVLRIEEPPSAEFEMRIVTEARCRDVVRPRTCTQFKTEASFDEPFSLSSSVFSVFGAYEPFRLFYHLCSI